MWRVHLAIATMEGRSASATFIPIQQPQQAGVFRVVLQGVGLSSQSPVLNASQQRGYFTFGDGAVRRRKSPGLEGQPGQARPGHNPGVGLDMLELGKHNPWHQAGTKGQKQAK